MKFLSTRNNDINATSAQAISMGIAPNGGLFVPERIPTLNFADFVRLRKMRYHQRTATIISQFLTDFTGNEILHFAEKAYIDNFPFDVAPVVRIDNSTAMLELFHGPTCAFKDMALQILPYLLTASLEKTNENRNVCILVATSGDTGKAALEGFKDVYKTCVIVFYPENGVSAVQKMQMVTQSGSNVFVCGVQGNFDDAQNGVKEIFADKSICDSLNKKKIFLSSANSINFGRLVPQIAYYFSAYLDLNPLFGQSVNICVPTGNFGNILAAYYAKKMGLPVNKIICASNQNNILTDFIKTGTYNLERDFVSTISPSMDILISSNVERLLFDLTESDGEKVSHYMKKLKEDSKYTLDSAEQKKLSEHFAAGYSSEDDTKATIKAEFARVNYLADPHTAVALKVLSDYRAETSDDTKTIVAATASPYKFCESVLGSLDGKEYKSSTALFYKLYQKTKIPIPKPLVDLRKSQTRFEDSVDKSKMGMAVKQILKV